MELTLALRAFEILLGWSLVLQTLEYLRVQQLDRVTLWPLLSSEIPAHPAWARPLLTRFFTDRNYIALLVLRLALAVALMFGQVGLIGATVLFALALLLLLRWRGAFNGGSDFMTLVGLTGLLIAHAAGALTHPDLGWRAGLWYVTLQTVSSYFVSGWVKLLRPEWRSGKALAQFLDSGVHGPLPAHSLFRRPWLAKICAWSFTVWEGCFPMALFDDRLAAVICAVATVFHGLVFRYFGLNRFFWAWLATFPGILYCAGDFR